MFNRYSEVEQVRMTRQLLPLKPKQKLRLKLKPPLRPTLKPKKKPSAKRRPKRPKEPRRSAEPTIRNVNKLKRKSVNTKWRWNKKGSLKNKPCKSSLKWRDRLKWPPDSNNSTSEKTNSKMTKKKTTEAHSTWR